MFNSEERALKVDEQKLYRDFMQYGQNTHKAEVCTSIGAVLLRLSKRYGGDSESKINSYIQALNEEINQQNDASLTSAWTYLMREMLQPPGELDIIPTYEGGIEDKVVIDLKTTVALVYAALTDKDLYKINSEQTEEKNKALEEKNQKDRHDNLYLTIKLLQTKAACPTEKRNDLVLHALSGIYPGVEIIESIVMFLRSVARQYLLELSKKIKDPKIYQAVLICELKPNSDRHSVLEKLINETDLTLMMEDKCRAHGLNPKSSDYAAAIRGVVKTIEEIKVPTESNIVLHNLQLILEATSKNDVLKFHGNAILAVQAWIDKEFQLADEGHRNQLISFAEVENTYINFKKYSQILSVWDLNKITPAEINRLSELLNGYYQSCSDAKLPVIASESLIESMKKFNTVCNRFQQDSEEIWIRDFFANWKDAEKEDRKELYAKLTDPVMCEKYQINLSDKFESGQATVSLDVHEVNRIFMYAITMNSKDWSEKFYTYFCEILKFVQNGCCAEDNHFTVDANALTKFSYPIELIEQLEYTKEYYEYTLKKKAGENISEPDPFEFYIPMVNFVRNLGQFWSMISYISSDKREKFFIEVVGIGSLKDFLKKNSEDLGSVCYALPEDKREKFLLETLGIDFLRGIIKNWNELESILFNLLPENQNTFLEKIGIAFLPRIELNVQNINDLGEIVGMFSPVIIKKLLFQFIKIDFLRSIIKNENDLENLFFSVPKDICNEFLFEKIGVEFLKSIIRSNKELKILLSSNNFEPQSKKKLLFLKEDLIKDLIKDKNSLRYVLNVLKTEELIEILDPNFIENFMTDIETSKFILFNIKLDARSHFLEKLLNSNLISKINNITEFFGILSASKILQTSEVSVSDSLKNSIRITILKLMVKDEKKFMEELKSPSLQIEVKRFSCCLPEKALINIIAENSKVKAVSDFISNQRASAAIASQGSSGIFYDLFSAKYKYNLDFYCRMLNSKNTDIPANIIMYALLKNDNLKAIHNAIYEKLESASLEDACGSLIRQSMNNGIDHKKFDIFVKKITDAGNNISADIEKVVKGLEDEWHNCVPAHEEEPVGADNLAERLIGGF